MATDTKRNEDANRQPAWYVVYTRPHHEKKVYKQLVQKNIHTYLPLRTTIRQWSDRKKKVTEPLFSCYVFVCIVMKEYDTVLRQDGVVRYVSSEGKAIKMPEKQITLIKNMLEQDVELSAESETFLSGARVEIKAGPLIGMEGELVEFSGKKRVIIKIEEINKYLFVNVPLTFLKQVG